MTTARLTLAWLLFIAGALAYPALVIAAGVAG